MSFDKEKVFCPRCDKSNNPENMFCSNCGQSLSSDVEVYESSYTSLSESSYTQREDNSFNIGNNDSDVEAFVAKNVPYYMEKFEHIKLTGSKITWNWASFFFGSYWMLYRKMYIEFVILLAGVLVSSFIPVVGTVLPFALPICFGMFGNSIYFNFVNKKLSEINNFNPNIKHTLIAKKGGTNLILPLVLFIILLLILISTVFYVCALLTAIMS